MIHKDTYRNSGKEAKMAIFKRKDKNGREITHWYFRFYVGKKEYCYSSGTTNKHEEKNHGKKRAKKGISRYIVTPVGGCMTGAQEFIKVYRRQV